MSTQYEITPLGEINYLKHILNTFETNNPGFKDRIGIICDDNTKDIRTYHIWVDGNPISNRLSFKETVSYIQVLFKGIELGLN